MYNRVFVTNKKGKEKSLTKEKFQSLSIEDQERILYYFEDFLDDDSFEEDCDC